VGCPAARVGHGRVGRWSGGGSWYVLELNHLPDGSGVMHLGHYDDTYVRDEGEWRFGVRRFHLVYRGAMDPGTVNPLPEG
jgi:hypothetical protein